jgi:hypothetical protein
MTSPDCLTGWSAGMGRHLRGAGAAAREVTDPAQAATSGIHGSHCAMAKTLEGCSESRNTRSTIPSKLSADASAKNQVHSAERVHALLKPHRLRKRMGSS